VVVADVDAFGAKAGVSRRSGRSAICCSHGSLTHAWVRIDSLESVLVRCRHHMHRSHRRLGRLDMLSTDSPVFFITGCTFRKHAILANPEAAQILIEEWETAPARHGWNVARFVIMPDHVHFFCAPREEASSLETFIGLEAVDGKAADPRTRFLTPRVATSILRSFDEVR
jgi:prephenate dehydratase